MTKLECFKAYDVRGRVPEELNEDIAYRIGRAYAEFVKPTRVAICRDIRDSSDALTEALVRGLTDAGVNALDIGVSGTELAYFATFHKGLDGGIMVTASHNPPNYNGMKFVREQSRPISADTGLAEIRALAEKENFSSVSQPGTVEKLELISDYIAHLLSYIEIGSLRPMKIVANAGNGGAGPIIDLLEPRLPFEFIKVHHEPDGSFPNGVPNPMLEENRQITIDHIRNSNADLGIAWDSDFDRCFFFDENGRFIEGYYIVGLLAQSFLDKSPGERIVHDPRLTWNTLEVVTSNGGSTVQSKSGHAFIKQTMRENDAVYGGEIYAFPPNHKYNPETDSWTPFTGAPSGHGYASEAVTVENEIYLMSTTITIMTKKVIKKMTTTTTIMTKKVTKKKVMMITDMDTKVMRMVSLTHIFG